MFYVVKRDGQKADFDITKINDAIVKAFVACEKQYNNDIIELLALRVTADFEEKIVNDAIGVEDIQDSVEKVLNQAGLDNIFNVLGTHVDVGRVVGHDPDNRSLGTEAKAACCHNVNTTAQSILSDDPDECVNNFQAARAITCRTTTTQHLYVAVSYQAIICHIPTNRIIMGTILFLDRILVVQCIH